MPTTQTIGAGGWIATMPLKTDRGITFVENDLVFTTRLAGRPRAPASTRALPRGLPQGRHPLQHARAEGLRFHDLRHSAVTILLAAAVPERVVMKILGHSTLAMVSATNTSSPG